MQTKNESTENSEEDKKDAATAHADAGKRAHAHSLRSLGVAATGVIELFFVFVLGDLLARSGIGWMRDISPNVPFDPRPVDFFSCHLSFSMGVVV